MTSTDCSFSRITGPVRLGLGAGEGWKEQANQLGGRCNDTGKDGGGLDQLARWAE